MAARLAFAVATNVEPDLLLVDEVLAVGDLAFQQRCLRRIDEYRTGGVTVILVSHDPALIAHTCEEVVWLQGGRVVAHGPTEEVLDRYVAENAQAAREATPPDLAVTHSSAGIPLVPGENRVGSQAAVVEEVRLLDLWGMPTEGLATGGGLVVEVSVRVPHDVGVANLSVRIVRSGDRMVCVDTSTAVDPEDALALVELERLDLGPGAYEVEVGLFDPTWTETHDHHSSAYPLQVTGDGAHAAVLAPPVRWHRSGAAHAPRAQLASIRAQDRSC
jgi:lipopolysaccharide transport system ATP-binding protein